MKPRTLVKYLLLLTCLFNLPDTLKGQANCITFGQSACLDGALGLYGNIIQRAIVARINHINDQGGIKGKNLKLISLNDSGDPRKTQKNIDHLRKEGIDMFIGNMGTRSILKILPLIKSKKIAIFFPWSGDEAFRNPELTNIINGPGLLKPQLTVLVNYIKKNINIEQIAIFHADDSLSTAASKDLIEELKQHNIAPKAVATYNRFTLDIATPANTLIATDPKIVICISTSMPTVKLINQFFVTGHYGTTFFGIDSTLFVGTIAHARGVDFYYSSSVPDPQTNTIQLAKQYRKDLKKYFPHEIPNILSFSYYTSAAIVFNAIQNIQGIITKEKIIEVIEKMNNYSIDGFNVTFNAKNRHAFGQDVSIIKG